MLDDTKKELLKKLYLLNREETEYLSKASVAEAISVLIEACEFSVGNYMEKNESPKIALGRHDFPTSNKSTTYE